jgi:hypothetical protein
MYLFALAPWWNDFYTAGGFYIGVLGCVVGVAGFWIALVQIKKTQRAALAARDAANKTLAETKEAYERFVAAFASRLLAELQNAANAKQWQLAHIRSHDLAELLATLPGTGHESTDAANIESVRSLREFGQRFAEATTSNKVLFPAKLVNERWKPLLQLLHARLDRLRAPFREQRDDQVSAHNPTDQVPGNRHQPDQQNQGGSGELGQDSRERAEP